MSLNPEGRYIVSTLAAWPAIELRRLIAVAEHEAAHLDDDETPYFYTVLMPEAVDPVKRWAAAETLLDAAASTGLDTFPAIEWFVDELDGERMSDWQSDEPMKVTWTVSKISIHADNEAGAIASLITFALNHTNRKAI